MKDNGLPSTINKLSISDLYAFYSILNSKLSFLDNLREKGVPVDFESYNECKIKRDFIDIRINELIKKL